MKHNVIAAAIFGACLIVAAFVFTGRYYLVRLESQRVARLDRWTGSVKVYDCAVDEYGFNRKGGSSCGASGPPTPSTTNVGDTMNVDMSELANEAAEVTENSN